MEHSCTTLNNTIIGYTDGHPIVCDIHFAAREKAPFVIFCHGFKGFKDWGEYPAVAHGFAENGLHFLRFNFSHNGGTVEQPIDFPDLEAFGENTFSKELHDLQQVIDHITDALADRLGDHGIGLLAHSRGAATAIITAAEDDRIGALCSWAGVSSIVDRLESYPTEEWKETGVHHIRNGRTLQDMPLYYSLYEDLLGNQDRFEIRRQCRALCCPHLVIHAADDTVVPPFEAERLEQWSPKSERLTLHSGGHTFGASHPSKGEGMPEPLSEACTRSRHFFKESLSRDQSEWN